MEPSVCLFFRAVVGIELSQEGAEWREYKANGLSRRRCVLADGQVPTAAGAGPATVPWVRGGVEEDAPRQEEETEGQGGEGEG